MIDDQWRTPLPFPFRGASTPFSRSGINLMLIVRCPEFILRFAASISENLIRLLRDPFSGVNRIVVLNMFVWVSEIFIISTALDPSLER